MSETRAEQAARLRAWAKEHQEAADLLAHRGHGVLCRKREAEVEALEAAVNAIEAIELAERAIRMKMLPEGFECGFVKGIIERATNGSVFKEEED